MGFFVTSDTIPASWKRTLAGNPLRSMNIVLAGMFNLMCLLALVKTFRILSAMRNTDPGLLLLFVIALFFIIMATVSIWQVYRRARAELQVQDDPTALVLSYLALRLYICVLGIAIMLLFTINLMHQ